MDNFIRRWKRFLPESVHCIQHYSAATFAADLAAGVTVGLVLEAKGIFGFTQISEVMVNAVLGSVIINELLAPFFVRFSLIKAGEAVQI